MTEYELEQIARRTMLTYLQSWGQSSDDRIEALNNVVDAAGIKARFNRTHLEWNGKSGEVRRAIEFQDRLDRDIFCGEFHQEVRNILALIKEFQGNAQEATFNA